MLLFNLNTCIATCIINCHYLGRIILILILILTIPDDCDMPRPLTIATSVNHYGGNVGKPAGEKHKAAPPFPSQLLGTAAGEASGSSSIGNLLMNIQGLLKVAVENARHHEQQTNYEKGQFTMRIRFTYFDLFGSESVFLQTFPMLLFYVQFRIYFSYFKINLSSNQLNVINLPLCEIDRWHIPGNSSINRVKSVIVQLI